MQNSGKKEPTTIAFVWADDYDYFYYKEHSKVNIWYFGCRIGGIGSPPREQYLFLFRHADESYVNVY